MSHPDLLAALEPVLDVFERLGVRYQVGGSVASSAYGMARATMDVDIVADLEDRDVAELVRSLEAEYFADAEMIRAALRDRSSFNLIHLPTMLKVDVFVPKQRRYDREALSRSRLDTLVDEPDARQVYVATPEDIVLQKLEWYRLGGEASERQWADVIGVLSVQADCLESDYLRRWAAELGIEHLLQRALDEL